MSTTRIPAIEGWFVDGEAPHLVGSRCTSCGTVAFPAERDFCRNPDCRGTDFAEHALSRTGTVWSYSVNHYAPPEPYVSPDPFVPYAVAAVELADEQLVVLGQVDGGPDAFAALRVGDTMTLVTDVLFRDDEGDHIVWKWQKVATAAEASR